MTIPLRVLCGAWVCMTSRADKFRQAGMTYVGVGVIVIILTLVVGASPTRGTPPLIGLAIGATFVVIFGALIYSYGRFDRFWVKKTVVVLTYIFVVTNALRTLQYVLNFLGYRLEINVRHFNVAIHPSEFTFPIIFLICAFLMVFITYMLARAAWDA